MRRFIAVLALIPAGAAVLPVAAAARSLEKELPPNRPACFARIYDAAHLASHPKQQVTQITLKHAPNTGETGQDQGEYALILSVEIAVRGKADTYSLSGVCKAEGQGLLCEPEWDAGTFRVEAAADGSLTVTNNGMTFNPSGFDAEEVAPGAITLTGDDKAWRLMPAGEQCGAAAGGPAVPNPR